jgi:uncharacterized membrane protein YhdT
MNLIACTIRSLCLGLLVSNHVFQLAYVKDLNYSICSRLCKIENVVWDLVIATGGCLCSGSMLCVFTGVSWASLKVRVGNISAIMSISILAGNEMTPSLFLFLPMDYLTWVFISAYTGSKNRGIKDLPNWPTCSTRQCILLSTFYLNSSEARLTLNMQNYRLSHFLGNHDLAIFHFMKLVTCSHQSPANQSNFLREFLYIVEVNFWG